MNLRDKIREAVGEALAEQLGSDGAADLVMALLEERGLLNTGAPSVEAAQAIVEKGGPVTEPERLAFEAWMHEHGWPLKVAWTGTEYSGALESLGMADPGALRTRQVWAAWRDRAALSTVTPGSSPEAESLRAQVERLRSQIEAMRQQSPVAHFVCKSGRVVFSECAQELMDKVEDSPKRIPLYAAPGPSSAAQSAMEFAFGCLWLIDPEVNERAYAARQALVAHLDSEGKKRGIKAAIDAGFEADHPPGADWWAGKKDA